MEREIKITQLTKDELSNLISTATYGDNSFDILVPKEYLELKTLGGNEDDCWEDELTNVLLNGGKIDIIDMEDEYDDANARVESKVHHLEEYNGYYHPAYRVGLEEILEGCSTDEGCEYAKELFLDEDGDFFTAYNLLQIIIFGEVVYG